MSLSPEIHLLFWHFPCSIYILLFSACFFIHSIIHSNVFEDLFIQDIIHSRTNIFYSFNENIHSRNFNFIHSKKSFIQLKNWLSPMATHSVHPFACGGISLCIHSGCSSQSLPHPKLPMTHPWNMISTLNWCENFSPCVILMSCLSELLIELSDIDGNILSVNLKEISTFGQFKCIKELWPFCCFVEDMTRAMYTLWRYLRSSAYD